MFTVDELVLIEECVGQYEEVLDFDGASAAEMRTARTILEKIERLLDA